MDSARFGGECVPSIAARVDDGIVAFEDAVAEAVLAQVFPDIFDWIEFGRIGWQLEQADILRQFELSVRLKSSGVIGISCDSKEVT